MVPVRRQYAQYYQRVAQLSPQRVDGVLRDICTPVHTSRTRTHASSERTLVIGARVFRRCNHRVEKGSPSKDKVITASSVLVRLFRITWSLPTSRAPKPLVAGSRPRHEHCRRRHHDDTAHSGAVGCRRSLKNRRIDACSASINQMAPILSVFNLLAAALLAHWSARRVRFCLISCRGQSLPRPSRSSFIGP
jgi:hypothetical protein